MTSSIVSESLREKKFLVPAELMHYDLTRPGTKINEILAIDVERETREMVICKLIFPPARLHFTDMKGVPPYVEKLSTRDAKIEYSYCDLMVICYPKQKLESILIFCKNIQG